VAIRTNKTKLNHAKLLGLIWPGLVLLGFIWALNGGAAIARPHARPKVS
jgi:hypothetical protein